MVRIKSYALDKNGNRILYEGPARTIINVNGVAIDTEKLSNDEYVRALVKGLEHMAKAGFDLNSIKA